jgi:hypothetical protein
MKLLLDTHTFLWFSKDNNNLSKTAKSLIEDTENDCFISTDRFSPSQPHTTRNHVSLGERI